MLRQDSLQTPCCTHMHKQSKAVSQELQNNLLLRWAYTVQTAQSSLTGCLCSSKPIVALYL